MKTEICFNCYKITEISEGLDEMHQKYWDCKSCGKRVNVNDDIN